MVIIIAGGEITDYAYAASLIKEGGFLIAADSGYRHCQRMNIVPNLVVGDFDSSTPPENVECMRLSPKKDYTDTLSAVIEGINRGFDDFLILGALGGRLDHTYANIQTLNYLIDHGKKGRIEDASCSIYLVHNGSITVKKRPGHSLSVFSYTPESKGVTLLGVEYPLSDYLMTSCFPIGVSNVITADHAEINVKDGKLMIFVSKIQCGEYNKA